MSDPRTLAEEDARARRLARSVFDRPVSLAAGAGTGKTATLVARLVAWLCGPGWEDARARSGSAPPERLARVALRGCVAITFTEAAALEMHERLGQALEALARGASVLGLPDGELPAEAAPRARALRDALEEPVASTIHGFARGLLARFPLEAGLQPGFVVDAEGRERERVVRELAEETLAEVLAHELDARWEELFRERVAPQDLASVLLGLLEHGARGADLARPRYDAARRQHWQRELLAALQALLDAGSALPGLGGRSEATCAALERLRGTLAACELSDARALEAWIRASDQALEKEDRVRLRAWSNGTFNQGEEQALGDELPVARAAARDLHALLGLRLAERPAFFELARELLAPLLAEARARLLRANVLAFDDLLHETQRLLEQPRVRRVLQAEIRQLCVDEFQDTDEVQCRIVAALALDPEARELPALFLVGDPKQSIYSWRSADLEAYERFLEALPRPRVAHAVLTGNFRSTGALLAEVQRWVEPAMRAERGLQPAFQPLQAVRGDTPAHPALELWVPWELDPQAARRLSATTARRASEIESAMVVHDLERQHAAGTAWKDCAVLVRARTHLPTLLEALRARSIPYEVSGDRSYYRRREVIDALSWIAAVLDPTDTLALLGALRSSAAGLPDAALPALWAEDFPAHAARLAGATLEELAPLERCVRSAARAVPEAVGGQLLPCGWAESLLDALETLGLLRHALATGSLASFFELLRMRTLLEATEAARFQGAWRAENLERLFERLARWLEGQRGDVDELLALVREDLAREREAELARPEELETDAVRVLTIHGAKGLEFPQVYVLGLGRRFPQPRLESCDLARAGGESELVLFGVPGPHWPACVERRRRVQAAEEVRTLYVAMTRARDRLVLSGVWPAARPALDPARPARTLDLLLPSLPEECFAALAAAADAHVAAPAGLPYLLRLPEAGDLVALEALARAPAGEPLPSPAARDLVAARARALARGALPWSASPSRLSGEEGEARPARRAASSPGGREIGRALHRALEQWDFARAPDVERARLAASLADEVPGARELFERFADGPLGAHFLAAGATLVARELPCVAAPLAGEAACASVGSIDLVYRDPADGRLVVVDYKTEALADAGELEERARVHAPQLAAYARILAAALPGEAPPRAELWFLSAGARRILA